MLYVNMFEIVYFMSKYTRRDSRKHRYLIHIYSNFYYLQQNKKTKIIFDIKIFSIPLPLAKLSLYNRSKLLHTQEYIYIYIYIYMYTGVLISP